MEEIDLHGQHVHEALEMLRDLMAPYIKYRHHRELQPPFPLSLQAISRCTAVQQVWFGDTLVRQWMGPRSES